MLSNKTWTYPEIYFSHFTKNLFKKHIDFRMMEPKERAKLIFGDLVYKM